MIREEISEFIEDYIDKIDEEDWEYIFDRWYLDSIAESHEEDELLLNEFFDTMSKAHIPDLKERTIEARKTIISKRIDDVISDIWGKYYNRTDTWNMYYSDIVTNLPSWLGFTQEELYEILNTYEDAGLTPKPEINAFEVEGI